MKYTPEQLFDLVANVEKYPEFIPWMIATRVRRRTDQAIWTDLTVGTGFLRKQFSTIARLDRPHGMTISSHDPVFARFEQRWTFDPLPEGGTDIRYHVDFRFKSLLLQALMDVGFADRAPARVYPARAPSLWRVGSACRFEGSAF